MFVTAKVEASTFAGMVGDPDQKGVITVITEDELKLGNPASTTGGKLELSGDVRSSLMTCRHSQSRWSTN